MKQKIEKIFFVLKIIPSEFVALNSLYQGRVAAIATQCVRKQF